MTITIKRLTFTELKDLMQSEHFEHVTELQSNTYKATYNPDWDVYEHLYDTGNLLGLMAFDDHVPVGYLNILSATLPHSKDYLVATADGFYVEPSYRRSGVMSELVAVAEELCRQGGVESLSLSAMQTKGDAGELAQSLGYEPAEVVYTKIL